MATEEPKPAKIYWAPAKQFQIGNFVKEKMGDMGRVDTREAPIRFHEHIRVTEDPKEIKYIESSDSFKAGTVIPCDDMAHAQRLTLQQDIMKTVREFHGEVNESSIVRAPEEMSKAVGIVAGGNA